MASKTDLHAARKAFHVLSGTLIAFLFVRVFSRPVAATLLLPCAALLGIADLCRLRWSALNALTLRIMGPLMREAERSQISSQFYYMAGLCFAVVVLPKPVAVQAVLTLAWMDPVAGSVGLRLGRRRWSSVFQTPVSIGKKTVEGSAAGAVAAFLAGAVAWTGPWAAVPGPERLWWPDPLVILSLSAVGAITAVLAEAWPSQWDDNINIPFWSGMALWVTATLLGVPMRYF